MSQLSIFEFIPGEVETFFTRGAMYSLVPEEFVMEEPIELGDSIIYPGQFVKRLGEKARSNFEMQEGSLLRYCGKIDNLILFSVNHIVSNYYYSFAYVDKNTLVIGSNKGCKDICIQKLELH